MAHGDVRPTKSSSGRRGSWGGSSIQYYDDEGRGKSQELWAWFQNYYAMNPTLAHLLEMNPLNAYQCIKYSVYRYGILDIATTYDSETDTRARRLVAKDLGEASWATFWKYLVDCYNTEIERQQKQMHEAAEKRAGEQAAYEAQRKAERAVVEREDYELLQSTSQLTIGQFESELNQVLVPHDLQTWGGGDYIDNAVEVITDGSGWMEENRRAKGVKVQITVSLDMSNSMIYNGCHRAAAEAFRDICWTLKALKAENPDNLFTKFFTFSQDQYDQPSYYGKKAVRLTDHSNYEFSYYENQVSSEHDLKELKWLAPSRIAGDYQLQNLFSGHDTWITPLYEEIETWEKEESDPGAVRLDIIITDAVLEHPKDIREADVVQERRNGSLQSVMLNFMPEKDWLGSTLPKRTFMTHVEKDNVGGILRQVLNDFIGANM